MKLLLKSKLVGRVSPPRAAAGITHDGAHGVARPTGNRSAFTMVEIALSLAIIGFALVAIVGVLPLGLNVQRENREETVVVHDANFFIDAIRSGARGLDDLTNYVESITNFSTFINPPAITITYGYTYTEHTINNTLQPAGIAALNIITNGYRIIGLLSTPKYLFGGNAYQNQNTPVPVSYVSNYVIAYIRALSGSAVEKSPQANLDVRDFSFRYRMISELVPVSNWSSNWVDFTALGLSSEEINIRSNNWRVARIMQANTLELRLNFRWPINGRREAGNQRQVFRTLVSGAIVNDPVPTPNTAFWFARPTTYEHP